jgi:hypothetical protein
MTFLSSQLSSVIAKLQREPERSREELRGAVEAHLETVRLAATANPIIDLDLAERVGAACLSLLGDHEAASPDRRRWIQVACRYFAQAHDGEDDFTSVIGFDDDVDVVNHVLGHLGRDDLFIETD